MKTPPPPGSNKDEPSFKKQRTDKGHLRITELGSDNDDQSGNESGVRLQPSDALVDTPHS